jgi:hypothetical protein
MKPTHLRRWVEYINYTGANYDDYYVATVRNFTCSPIEREEFAHVRESMHDTGGSPLDVLDVTCSDELLHARYYVLVHEAFGRGMRMGEMFARRREEKGYILTPETESDTDFEEESQPILKPAPVTGHFCVIPGTLSTSIFVRKKQANSKHEAARKKVIRETEALTGRHVSVISRSIDGVRRRWDRVKANQPTE